MIAGLASHVGQPLRETARRLNGISRGKTEADLAHAAKREHDTNSLECGPCWRVEQIFCGFENGRRDCRVLTLLLHPGEVLRLYTHERSRVLPRFLNSRRSRVAFETESEHVHAVAGIGDFGEMAG